MTGVICASLRHLARRVYALHPEINEYDHQVDDLLRALNPVPLRAKGVGVISAGQLLITAGDNADRIYS